VKEIASVYAILLSLHSVVRWLVLAAGIVAVAAAIRAASTRGRPAPAGAGLLFAILLDIQVLLGLLLYLRFSPLTTAALRHLDRAMTDDTLRFWAVEHPFGMLAGLAFAHAGSVRARKSAAAGRRDWRTALYFGLALLLVAASVPWPFMPYGRPLL
jgi:hypothetical protein